MISLDGMRKSMKAWLKWGIISFLLIFTISIFFGYMSYNIKSKTGGLPDPVFTVDGTKVSRDHFMKVVAYQEDMYQKQARMYGDRPIMNQLAQTWLGAYSDILEGIVLDKEAHRRKIKVSKGEVKANINSKVQEIIKGRWKDEKQLREYLVKKGITKADLEKQFSSQFSPDAIKHQMMMDKLKAQVTADVQVSEADLKNSYQVATLEYLRIPDYPTGKESPDAAKAAAQKKSEAVQAALKQHKSFDELVKKYSADPAEPREFHKGDMVKPMDDAVFAAKPGEIKGPIETEYGIFYFKLIKKEVQLPKDYEKNKAKLLSDLLKKRKDDAWKAFVNKLKNSATVELADPLLAGLKAYGAGDKEKAKEYFTKAAKIYTNYGTEYAVATGWLGQLAEQEGDFQTARDYYQKAADSGGDATLYVLLGQAKLKLKDKKGALDDFATASDMATEEPGVHNQLMRIYQNDLKDKQLAKHESDLEQDYYRQLYAPPPGSASGH